MRLATLLIALLLIGASAHAEEPAVASPPATAPAQAAPPPSVQPPNEPTFQVVNTLRAQWEHAHKFEDLSMRRDDALRLRNQLAPELSWGPINIGARLEITFYPDALVERPRGATCTVFSADCPNPLIPADKPGTTRSISKNDYRLEKVYAAYERRDLRVVLGDTYATFGRGLALSFRKRGEDEIDNTLRGGLLEWRKDAFSMSLVSGLSNILNLDNTRGRKRSDPNDLISGLRLEGRFLDFVKLGVHGVFADFGTLLNDDTRSYLAQKQSGIVGMTFELPSIANVASLSVEADYLHRIEREVDPSQTRSFSKRHRGYAVYAAANGYAGDLTINAEYKLYRHFLFRPGRTALSFLGQTRAVGFENYDDILYNDAPTLERQDLDIDGEYSQDQGGRLKLEYNIRQSATRPYVAAYYDRRVDLNSHSDDLQSWHVYGGVTQLLGPVELILDGGFRDERDLEHKATVKRLSHAKLSLNSPLAPGHHLSFEAQYLRKDEVSKRHAGDTGDFVLTYTLSRYFALSFFYTLLWQDYLPSEGHDHFSHLFAGEFRTRFSRDVEFSIFGGQIREGVRCYGGACKKIPAFEGVKGRLMIRI